MKKRKFVFLDVGYDSTAWEEFPSTCPHCGRSMSPIACFSEPFCDAYLNHYQQGTLVELFKCTFDDCQRFFIVAYKITHYSGLEAQTRSVIYSYSHSHVPVNVPDKVNRVSSMFVKIYTQAVQAENAGLDEIAGIGYRKALEFLVKDYAVKAFPDREEAIKSEKLGKVIADELGDFPRLKKLAKAANWIGTDQTHYIQKFSDADLQSMKSFITSAALFIAADENADDAQEFTDKNDPKKSQEAVDK